MFGRARREIAHVAQAYLQSTQVVLPTRSRLLLLFNLGSRFPKIDIPTLKGGHLNINSRHLYPPHIINFLRCDYLRMMEEGHSGGPITRPLRGVDLMRKNEAREDRITVPVPVAVAIVDHGPHEKTPTISIPHARLSQLQGPILTATFTIALLILLLRSPPRNIPRSKILDRRA